MTRAVILASLTLVLVLFLGFGWATREWSGTGEAGVEFDSQAWKSAGMRGSSRKARARMLPDLLNKHIATVGTAHEAMLLLGDPDWRTEDSGSSWHWLTTDPYAEDGEPDNVELRFDSAGRFSGAAVHDG